MSDKYRFEFFMEGLRSEFCCGMIEVGNFNLEQVGVAQFLFDNEPHVPKPNSAAAKEMLVQFQVNLKNNLGSKRHVYGVAIGTTLLMRRNGIMEPSEVLLNWLMKKAGMVMVRDFVNPQTGNTVGLWVSPYEWPKL